MPNKNPRNIISDFHICNSRLVDPARGNWNCIFDCLKKLCERLDELDIESLIEY